MLVKSRLKTIKDIILKKLLTLITLSILLSLANAQTVSELINAAQNQVEQWNFAEAVELFNKALQLDSSNAELYYLSAAAKSDNGQ